MSGSDSEQPAAAAAAGIQRVCFWLRDGISEGWWFPRAFLTHRLLEPTATPGATLVRETGLRKVERAPGCALGLSGACRSSLERASGRGTRGRWPLPPVR